MIGEDGKPLKDAIIHIDRKDIKGAYKTKSDKKGEFIHAGLPLGTYNIAVEIGGKEVDGVNNIRTRLGDPTPVNFDLQKIAAARSAKQAQAQQANAAGAAAGAAGQALTKEQERGMTKEQKENYDKAIKEREASMKRTSSITCCGALTFTELMTSAPNCLAMVIA